MFDALNSSDMDEMVSYYRERAPVYDRVYQYPERQADLRFLESHIPEVLKGRRVLEVASGTGYWTECLSTSAKSILATDRESAQLDLLSTRHLKCPVQTRIQDAYHLDRLVDEGITYSGAFAGLWLSHVPKQRLNEFFCSLHQCLRPGAVVVLLDNSLAQCDQFPLIETDAQGNTYQLRELDSGSIHRVLKNFPAMDELKQVIAPFGQFRNYISLENFWLFQYTVRK